MKELDIINEDQKRYNKELEKLDKGTNFTICLILLIAFASFILGFIIGLGID